MIVTGSFPQDDNSSGAGLLSKLVFLDKPGGQFSSYTNGGVRVTQSTSHPTASQRWRISGWTVRLSFGANWIARFGGVPAFASMGQIWAGIAVDGFAANSGGCDKVANPIGGFASFPVDLSTFALVWDGSSSPLPRIDTATGQAPGGGYQTIGFPYQIQTPLIVTPSSQIQMVLIITRSLMSAAMNAFAVQSCDYSIIYDMA